MIVDTKDRVAVFGGRRIGDTLISLVYANNLQESGYDVTVFSAIFPQFKDLFPQFKFDDSIYEWGPHTEKETPHPSLEGYAFKLFPSSGLCFVHTDPEVEKKIWADGDHLFHERISLSHIAQKACKTMLKLPVAEQTNGIHLPEGYTQRKYKNRVLIHPTASNKPKSWQKRKFIRLAKRLEKRGFEPVFWLAPYERAEWEDCPFPLIPKGSFFEIACFAYESGYFIGNDSGIGHLCSNLGIPTLTLSQRKTLGTRWRPSWSTGHLLYPKPLLPGGKLKERFWKHLMSVSRAEKGFDTLLEKVGA